HADVVRQQRGGEGIARMALVGKPVECEADWSRAIDPTAARHSAHRRPVSALGMISWVVVSRTRVNQRRQPAVWTQRSTIFPFGFGRKKTKRAQVASSTLAGSAG